MPFRPTRGTHRVIRFVLFAIWCVLSYLALRRAPEPAYQNPADYCDCAGPFHSEACIFDGLKRDSPKE